MEPRPRCAPAATLTRLPPELPESSVARFDLAPRDPAGGAPTATNDVGPDRGVSHSSQRSRCRDVPANVHTEHVHVLPAAGRALPLLGSLCAHHDVHLHNACHFLSGGGGGRCSMLSQHHCCDTSSETCTCNCSCKRHWHSPQPC